MQQFKSRSLFDWAIFLLIYASLVGGIAYAALHIYGPKLGAWVAASAAIAGLASLYIFHNGAPGETLMKIVLGLAVALNAAYLVHNGARQAGVEAFNNAQVRKYEAGMAAAGQASSRAVARQLSVSTERATALEKMFSDGVALVAAVLAFFELAIGLACFAVASRRGPADSKTEARRTAALPRYVNGRSDEFESDTAPKA